MFTTASTVLQGASPEELSTRKRALCWANTGLREWHPSSENKGGVCVPSCNNTLVSTAPKHVAGYALDLQKTSPAWFLLPPPYKSLWNTQGAHGSSPALLIWSRAH